MDKECYFNNTDNAFTATIKITIPYKELKCFYYPETCAKCPIRKIPTYDCGKHYPWTKLDSVERSDFCKLEKINIADIIKSMNLSNWKGISINDSTCVCDGRPSWSSSTD